MWRIWLVEAEGKKYEVEARYGFLWDKGGRGELLVNGEVVDSWRSSVFGLPKQRVFEIAGRRAVLRRVGVVKQNLELFVNVASVQKVK